MNVGFEAATTARACEAWQKDVLKPHCGGKGERNVLGGFLRIGGVQRSGRLSFSPDPWIVSATPLLSPFCYPASQMSSINLIFRSAFQAVGIRNLYGARPTKHCKLVSKAPCRKVSNQVVGAVPKEGFKFRLPSYLDPRNSTSPTQSLPLR